MKHRRITMMLGVFIAGTIGLLHQGGPRAIAADAGNPNDGSNIEVLTRGPVHEAFAEPISYDPTPGVVMPNEPPAAIEEIPPDERPEGDALWIPGYWQWDNERSDFIWISGIWRDPRPTAVGFPVIGFPPPEVGAGRPGSGRPPNPTRSNIFPGHRKAWRSGHPVLPLRPIASGRPVPGSGPSPVTPGDRGTGCRPILIGSGCRRTTSGRPGVTFILMGTGIGRSSGAGFYLRRCMFSVRFTRDRIMSIRRQS